MTEDNVRLLEPIHRAPSARPRRGRPIAVAPDEVLRRIRQLGERGELFRVHQDHPALYARARRQFGAWAGAVARAGLDHSLALAEARRRAVDSRRARGGRCVDR